MPSILAFKASWLHLALIRQTPLQYRRPIARSLIEASVLLLISCLPFAYPINSARADSDYAVGRFVRFVGTGANPSIITLFLPSNVNVTTIAILQWQVSHTQNNHNEIFINPLEPFCADNRNDFNESQAVALIEDYDADGDMLDDFFTQYSSFESRLLRGGVNSVMVCSRNSSGGLSGGLDGFSIAEIVLHFQTMPLIRSSAELALERPGKRDMGRLARKLEKADDQARYQMLYEAWRAGLSLPTGLLRDLVINAPLPDVRALALKAIASQAGADTQGVQEMAEAALNDPDWTVEYLAREILIQLEDLDLGQE